MTDELFCNSCKVNLDLVEMGYAEFDKEELIVLCENCCVRDEVELNTTYTKNGNVKVQAQTKGNTIDIRITSLKDGSIDTQKFYALLMKAIKGS